MRLALLAGVACATMLIGPMAVADATADRAMLDLLENPQTCGPGGSALEAAALASATDMVMVDGFGPGGFAVDTDNAQAQAWFDHGVRLRWAFEHSESVRAFRKARALDPTCGMCAWGEAWAMGPNINGGGRDDESIATGLKTARDARRLGRRATPMQRQMIDALIQRYSGRKETRDLRFARAMDRIVKANPDNVAAINVAADAWMLNAREWWDKDGQPADPGIPRAMQILEHALTLDQNDPGAIHLYIHLTEWSDDPHKALPHGERLARIAPGSSHLVHMPSHTFYRVGRYRDAMNSNIEAVALDYRYDRLARPPGGVQAMLLHGHNIHFGMGGALMANGAEEGLKLADAFMTAYPTIPPSSVRRQVMVANAYAVYGRFADQERVAALAEPPLANPQMRISWRYARGEAAARRGDAAAVRAEAAAIEAIRLAMPYPDRNPETARVFAELPQRVLEGRAAMIDGDHAAAIVAFSQGDALQRSVDLGGDPPAWWYPIGRSVAAAKLAAGDAAGAKAAIQALARDWPADPYSHFVLAEAEAALGDATAAEAARRQAAGEWVGGEMTLAGA